MALDLGTRPKARRRRRYFHGGALAMLLIATVLAAVTALVSTVVYAKIDAGRPLTTTPPPTTVPSAAATTAVAETTTTSRRPEILSPEELAKKVAPTVRSLRSLDPQGQPVEGTAFVVGSFGGQTLLVTSFQLVRASVRSPGPDIVLGTNQKATLWTWQEDRDLALLTVGGSIESLPWATVAPKTGDKIFAAPAGQKVSPGIVTAASDVGIEHNIFVDDMRQGAPIVTQKGEVVGLASKVYNPNGKATDTVFVAVPIRLACERVLRCGGGNTAPGENGPAATTTTSAAPSTSTTRR